MKKFLALSGAMFLGLASSAFAAVNIESRTGLIRISNPQAAPVDVKVGDPLPLIADGAVIEVLEGAAKIVATEGSHATVVVRGQSFPLAEGLAFDVAVDSSGQAHVGIDIGAKAPVVEGYQAPQVDDPATVERLIRTEESTRDISPVQQ